MQYKYSIYKKKPYKKTFLYLVIKKLVLTFYLRITLFMASPKNLFK